ncbi:hypothetical protein BASA50_011327 [Batrachochytrium salamandrivorans]|uniref:Poly A polymerase head domain-containing protein n=1 Tax=Batrachochytrium salamandrivorans TaxID=1357716 RepID=A0ABQ8EWE2_9FUNG|nr:hypothetical protein BASA50_011327 [Batrachochytrium salamandrivorans]KAH6602231.1 hypothetical protein BASA61_001289 [Batrachochytrium salamandrivorans]
MNTSVSHSGHLKRHHGTLPIPKVTLTNTESKIRELLLSTAAHIQSAEPDQPPLVLRIAGGWVRDKLLGKDSDDIDIAINSMKGEPFAHHLKAYMLSIGLTMSAVATIQVNPDKSKHLETATARVFGHDIDFVHLRTEIYDGDSRNPIVDFGTPLEDTLRRDITINAMFYNLHTGEIEDLSGKGLDDLSSGTIRTPLGPLKTFEDDPLRVLRVIRFATRFGYKIVPEILTAAADDFIKSAFIKKITRERIGAEMDKMLSGPDPVRAVKLIVDIGFYPLVFRMPSELSQLEEIDPQRAYLANYILDLLYQSHQLPQIGLLQLPLSNQNYRNLHLAACMLPYHNQTFKLKNKEVSVVRHIVCNSIKLSNNDGDVAHALVNSYVLVRDIAVRNFAEVDSLDRMFVRELGARPIGANWDLAVLMALIHDLTNIAISKEDTSSFSLKDDEAVKAIAMYSKLLNSITFHQVHDAHAVKPLLDGKEIAALLGIKPSPQIGRYLYHVMEWQLTHTHTTKEQCIEFLQARFGNRRGDIN